VCACVCMCVRVLAAAPAPMAGVSAGGTGKGWGGGGGRGEASAVPAAAAGKPPLSPRTPSVASSSSGTKKTQRCCSMLQFVAVCTVCCNVLQCLAAIISAHTLCGVFCWYKGDSAAAVCSSVWQCVAMGCIVAANISVRTLRGIVF